MSNTMQFLRELRLFIAGLSPSRMAVGEIAKDGIRRVILPEVEDLYNSARNERERNEYEKLLDIWRRYADDRTPEGKSWNTEAAKVIVNVARRFRLSDTDLEEIAAEVALSFMTSARGKIFERFNVETGPDGLRKLFKRAVQDATKDAIKHFLYERRNQVSLNAPTDGEGGSLQDMMGRPSGDLTDIEGEEVMRDMFAWVKKRLDKDYDKLIFKNWAKLVKQKGAKNVNWSRDIEPVLVKEMNVEESAAKGLVYWSKKRLKELIRKYFRDELGVRMQPSTLKSLKLSSRVAVNYRRRLFSQWMLSPSVTVMRYMRASL